MGTAADTTVPAPLSLSPTWSWSGNDGSWSTFDISVGTPPQAFYVLPSTTGSETWVPIPAGCEGILINIPNCGLLRGVQYFDGEASRGFQTNASSTWDLLGLYQLENDQNLWSASYANASYGLDTVSLEMTSSGKSVNVKSQTIAGYATGNVWLGSFGLGTAVGTYAGVHQGSIPSLMESLKSQNYTPGVSFGYAAGASYSSPQDYGSLVIGGYDQARFKPSDLNFTITGTDQKKLPVRVASVVVENAFGGTLSLLPGGNAITTIIDSTVAQMWLPQNVCDLFAQAYGLTYDTTSGLYLVNSTTHRQLTQLNPTVTFSIGDTKASSSTTNIELPYSAFDLQASIPLFNATTNYFPLRVAANKSQQVLGRAFLQEAYIFVDWEREYFTVGQTIHQNSTSKIVPVLSPSYDSGGGSDSSLSTGAIAGLSIAGVVVIAAIALAAYLITRRRRRRRTQTPHGDMPMELHSEHVTPPEAMSAQVYEMQDAENSKHELYAKPLLELQASTPESELEGDGERFGKFGGEKKPATYYELP